mgnify:CR=1 FL=1
MSHDHSNSTKHIWVVFFILLVLTGVEVLLGIYKPAALEGHLFEMKLLNWVFIILTLVKAYFIVADFMHLKHETKTLNWALGLPMFILIPYLMFILLSEAVDLI